MLAARLKSSPFKTATFSKQRLNQRFPDFGLSATANQFWTQFFSSGRVPALWYLLLAIFDLSSSRRWRWTTHALALFYAGCGLADCGVILLWQNAGSTLHHLDTALNVLPALLPAYSVVLIVCGMRRHPRLYLWPLAAAAVLTEVYAFLVDSSQLFIYTGWRAFFWPIKPQLVLGRYNFSLHALFNMLLSLMLIVTVAQVQARYRRRQAALEMEVQSAREVQQVLMPEELPAIPGFSLATAYLPAGEVGGDFFQTIQVPEGVLIVLGDVSGKGMGAAMTVSLIVGTVRTLCEADAAPAAILEGLNRRLLGRTRGGFATCLAVLVTADGRLRLANAGHLSPFLSGRELVLSGSLPLGLVAGVTYEEQINWLPVGDQLTLYTDGVLEARNRRGELYGFERVAHLLARNPSPEMVLAASCNFGQDDDITVLALTRLS